jgi:hypothetical protein
LRKEEARLKTSRTTPLGFWGVVGCGLALWAVVATSGCADDDEGDAAASLASCNSWCDAYIAAACPAVPLYPNADMCKLVECADIPVQPRICQTEFKTYYDCRGEQADLCADMDCEAEFSALLTCM